MATVSRMGKINFRGIFLVSLITPGWNQVYIVLRDEGARHIFSAFRFLTECESPYQF